MKQAALDFSPELAEMKREIWAGLSSPRKWIAPKFFYDETGSRLFEKICRQEAYYVTRAETEILKNHGREIAECLGEQAILVEPGAGACQKVRHLLAHLRAPVAYVPVEISRDFLIQSAADIQRAYPGIQVWPVCADYTKPFRLPAPLRAGRISAFFPGSTIGNMAPAEATLFLAQLRALISQGGAVIVGVDRKKDKAILERAYDDPAGVTALFNLNVLERINREFGATFQVENFRHEAVYNESAGRIEMHLVSLIDQIVSVAGNVFRFRAGEVVHTENSYKYSVAEFAALGKRAGLRLDRVWSDSADRFSEYLFRADCGPRPLTEGDSP